MKTHPFPAAARLKGQKAVDNLFLNRSRGGCSCLCYPLRAVWIDRATVDARSTAATSTLTRLLISVPKKKLRHAVDRTTARRRIREAWRLADAFRNTGNRDVAIIYVADKLKNYDRISAAVSKIIANLQA